MKAVAIVVAAVVALIGLGYEFANVQFHRSEGALGASNASGEAGLESAQMHPEALNSQPRLTGPRIGKGETSESNPGSSISFEGAELPGAFDFTKNHQSPFAKGIPAEWQDSQFISPSDQAEAGMNKSYAGRKLIYPHEARVGHEGAANDDLLIMEDVSENRFAASALKSASQN